MSGTESVTLQKNDALAADHPVKVQVKNLDFFYGQTRALKGINLPLYKNIVTAFIGPSGCGKSTLLRVLNRMYDLYPGQRATGEVLLDGHNVLDPKIDLNLLRARIGMVFQKPTPFPMTIYDNISFGIKLYEKLPKSEMDGRVEMALKGRCPLERSEGQAWRKRAQPFGRPTATALHCTHSGHQAGSHTFRRTMLGA